jgi:hypothetical protein
MRSQHAAVHIDAGKQPFEREILVQTRISAVIAASELTAATPGRPAQAATDASAPRFALFFEQLLHAGLIHHEEHEIRLLRAGLKPQLPLASCMNTGALHCSPARQAHHSLAVLAADR